MAGGKFKNMRNGLVGLCICSFLMLMVSAPLKAASPQGENIDKIVHTATLSLQPRDQLEISHDYANAMKKEFNKIKLVINHIEANVKSGPTPSLSLRKKSSTNPDDLNKLREMLNTVSQNITAIIKDVAPYLDEASERLLQLGKAPEDGSVIESKNITNDRKTQEKVYANYQSVDTQARVFMVQIEQIEERITTARWNSFTERIFEKKISGLNPQLWYNVALSLPVIEKRIAFALSDWWSYIGKIDIVDILLLITIFAVAYLIPLFINRLLLRFFGCTTISAPKSDLQKNTAATCSFLIHIFIYALSLAIIYSALLWGKWIPPTINGIVISSFANILLYAVIIGLLIAILRPKAAKWRLVSLNDKDTKSLMFLLRSMALIYVIGQILIVINMTIVAPLIIRIGQETIISGLITILLSGALITISKSHKLNYQRWHWPGMFALAWLSNLTIIVSIMVGFLSFASFISSQVIIAGTVLTALKLVSKLINTLLKDGLEISNQFSTKIVSLTGIPSKSLIQIGIIVSALIRVALIGITILLLAIPWGIAPSDVFIWLQTKLFGFDVGDSTFSFTTLLLGILLFLSIILITKSAKRWLENAYLPHTSLDIGIRNSIKTAFGYCGYLIAIMVGLSYVGLDLSSIAIVAGALSVGIGFGLQSIVNNFVSGLILLAERPIKAGDWIVADGAEGYVRKISVRATEIETFSRASVIIPNSTLISSLVTNFTHNNRSGRVIIPVGVSYDTDPLKVQEILLKCANNNHKLLSVPEPKVFFINFGEYNIQFELRAYLPHIDDLLSVCSDLRYDILTELHKNGIEIPVPQYDVIMQHKENEKKDIRGSICCKKDENSNGN